MRGIHAPHRLHSDDGREAAVAQFGFDQCQQIVGLVLVALGVGVAGDTEKFVSVDPGLREEQVESVRHHVLERDEAPGAVDPQKARDAEPDRHLDPRQRQLSVVGARNVTSRLSERLEMNGNGCAGSIACGVISGKMLRR